MNAQSKNKKLVLATIAAIAVASSVSLFGNFSQTSYAQSYENIANQLLEQNALADRGSEVNQFARNLATFSANPSHDNTANQEIVQNGEAEKGSEVNQGAINNAEFGPDTSFNEANQG